MQQFGDVSGSQALMPWLQAGDMQLNINCYLL